MKKIFHPCVIPQRVSRPLYIANGIKLWNELQVDVRSAQCLSSFKRKLKFKFLSCL